MAAAKGEHVARVVGRYALYGEIAAGGTATVHYGRLTGPAGFSRIVAIKRLHAHLAKDPAVGAMLLDEARVAARIRHPNVVSILDVVAADGELLLVMEYVHGESLSALLSRVQRSGRAVAIPIACAIVCGALRGLHAAHEAKNERGEPLHLVHRDISPQNVIVGVDGVTRVLDFGIAKAVGRSQTTREGELKGKIGYMAPEQLRHVAIDRRSDIYAAGVVLWEALTAKRLFEGDNDWMTAMHVLEDEIAPPSRHVAGIPDALDAIVLRAAASDRGARFDTASDMADAIERAVRVALPSEVAAWVETLAGDALASRSAIVADVESSSDAPAAEPPSAQAPAAIAAPAPSAPRRVRRWALLPLFGVAAAGAAFLAARTLRPASGQALARDAAEAPLAVSATTTNAAASAEAPNVQQLPVVSITAAVTAKAPAAPRKSGAPAKPSAAASASGPCTKVKWIADDSGILHPQPDCP